MKKVLLLILSLCLFAPIMIAQTGNDDPIGIVIGESGGIFNGSTLVATPSYTLHVDP